MYKVYVNNFKRKDIVDDVILNLLCIETLYIQV